MIKFAEPLLLDGLPDFNGHTNIYVISDSHHDHANIIRYCNRPFKDVDHMNEVLIANWNAVVGPDDPIIHVGDFALGRRDKIPGIVKRLNGIKYLVRGNHDRSSAIMEGLGFKTVARSMILNFGGKRILFHHYPPPDLIMPLGFDIVIHGHTHHTELISAPGIFNLSVEAINYKPMLLTDVLKLA